MDYFAKKKLSPAQQHAIPYERKALAYIFAASISVVAATGTALTAVGSVNINEKKSLISVDEDAPVMAFLSLLFVGAAGGLRYAASEPKNRAKRHLTGLNSYGLIGDTLNSIHATLDELLIGGRISKKEKKVFLKESVNLFENIVNKYQLDENALNFPNNGMKADVDNLLWVVQNLPVSIQGLDDGPAAPEI